MLNPVTLGGPGSREPVHRGRFSPWLSVTRACLALCALRGLVLIVALTSEQLGPGFRIPNPYKGTGLGVGCPGHP